MALNKNQIAQNLYKILTNLGSSYTFEKTLEKVNKYINLTVQCISSPNLLKDSDVENFYYSRRNFYIKMGKVKINDPNDPTKKILSSLFEIIQMDASTRLFFDIQVGNSITKKLTLARLEYPAYEILDEINDYSELFVNFFEKHIITNPDGTTTMAPLDEVPIDTQSLSKYIRELKSSLPTISDEKRSTVIRNLNIATRIKLISEFNNGKLPQIISESKFGRKYYKGINLQTCPKEVRHAALGDCYELDFDNSVFSWKWEIVNTIYEEKSKHLELAAHDDYLINKNARRTGIAADVFNDVSEKYINIVKEAITAIGFGAPLRGNQYRDSEGKFGATALCTIIPDKELRTKFINHPWVKKFSKAQNTLNSIMFNFYAKKNFETYKKIPTFWNKKGNLIRSKILSYEYQQFERSILDSITKILSPATILLTVHDCVYTKYAPNVAEAKQVLKTVGYTCTLKEHLKSKKHLPKEINDFYKKHEYDPAFDFGYKVDTKEDIDQFEKVEQTKKILQYKLDIAKESVNKLLNLSNLK